MVTHHLRDKRGQTSRGVGDRLFLGANSRIPPFGDNFYPAPQDDRASDLFDNRDVERVVGTGSKGDGVVVGDDHLPQSPKVPRVQPGIIG